MRVGDTANVVDSRRPAGPRCSSPRQRSSVHYNVCVFNLVAQGSGRKTRTSVHRRRSIQQQDRSKRHDAEQLVEAHHVGAVLQKVEFGGCFADISNGKTRTGVMVEVASSPVRGSVHLVQRFVFALGQATTFQILMRATLLLGYFPDYC